MNKVLVHFFGENPRFLHGAGLFAYKTGEFWGVNVGKYAGNEATNSNSCSPYPRLPNTKHGQQTLILPKTIRLPLDPKNLAKRPNPSRYLEEGNFEFSQEHYGFQKGKRRKTTQTYQVDPQQSWTINFLPSFERKGKETPVS